MKQLYYQPAFRQKDINIAAILWVLIHLFSYYRGKAEDSFSHICASIKQIIIAGCRKAQHISLPVLRGGKRLPPGSYCTCGATFRPKVLSE